ncbi:phosphoenolpyruvate carboxykinase [Candidatus Micrarchaeota archaeon CG1_02_55_22]|nr:MAG: phosphoenolpyruvate carboxykinase [Candidatus Micrarchaeota archaeon CG1_02_55_22]
MDEINTGITKNKHLLGWIAECVKLCKPERVWWLDGSDADKERLTEEAYKTGDFLPVNAEKHPGCHLHRSAHNDVARTEKLTFICTRDEGDCGPTNNWMAPSEAYPKLSSILDGSMAGRTMYVIPFSMGPIDSPARKIGVEITDSAYVALSMMIMTRVGIKALDALGDSDDFTRCLHGKADLHESRRFICHFPEDNAVWSVGSGYGGNALLGKKCLALRLASWQGKKEGWLAEHMLITAITNPAGKTHFVAAAFPSACGKTNLSMLVPPKDFAEKGWKVQTLGDDIAWIRVGEDGRFYAINPEAGFFGVAPGTNEKTNPNAMKTISKNTIFTNVLQRDDGSLWWEGHSKAPEKGIDWKGEEWTPEKGSPGSHPNSRFTAPLSQCPSLHDDWETPKGVPLSAIIFGGRRAKLAPLVFEAFNWQHGTFVGATMASETTAAATGAVGVVRRDPMAMLPFIGYNVGDYFRHWLERGAAASNAPKIFHVNWFKRNADGKYLWPGYGENLRVLKWIIERCDGRISAVKTPIGLMPRKEDLDLRGLDLSEDAVEELLAIDTQEWLAEVESQAEFLSKLGERVPDEIYVERGKLKDRLMGNKG